MNSTRIVYVTHTRFPTQKAHGLATLKLCEALVREGFRVEILAPRLWQNSTADPFNSESHERKVPIRRVFTIDLPGIGFSGRLGFLIYALSFSIKAFFYCLRYPRSGIVFFSHDYIPLALLAIIRQNVFYDVHHFPGWNPLYRILTRRAGGFGTQTRWKNEELQKRFSIPASKIVYWPNGTDLRIFNVPHSKEAARKILGIPLDKKVVIYTGHLFPWKGVDTLVAARRLLPENYVIYIVGGEKNNRRDEGGIVYIPFQAHEKIPLWLWAADVLVLPNTGKEKVSLYYTSPLKLFEYMASRRPIVASRLPSITEILSEEIAYLAEPDDPASFAVRIQEACNDGFEANRRAIEAEKRVRRSYTWEERARHLAPLLHLTSNP